MKNSMIVVIMFSLILMLGCQKEDDVVREEVSVNPTAEEVLKGNQDLDIFQWDGVIYQANIDWVDALELTKKEQIGEIRRTFSEVKGFGDGDATRLPAGAKVFNVTGRGDVLIVDVGGKTKHYLALIEG
ncbi:hypothetical protein BMT55_02125 [Listeria newyorkensis]|uniref:Lipoprotein n=1 Tax=Listeria newyorkensis TaxID=1497681 RepID=A0ABX4XPZ9_9LIST|nr:MULTISPECIES: hypothetical protein [Listeria]KGL42218.1 hypothetical protein EP56_10820 [Listeriaceae bacterium FSL A5-0209]KGL38189.1 hypothetical protein EP58_15640 [Listeria newyorkensis]KMT63353.1 hypothetical protein X559_0242 [Listeria newyorkensis]PNP94306.1 hypothetical protein BMT55_02125 [Listeria newyorkensis]RQW67735.1 hypothetical protein DUK53_05305 [Listeria sp. SHR_NRA_18]